MKKLVLIGLLSLSMTFKVFAMARGASAPSSPSGLDKDLMSAAVAGNAELVKALIEQGANILVQSKAGTTPLLAAVNQGHFDVVKTLLDAKFNVPENIGAAALVMASQKRFELINKQNNSHTALMISINKGNIDIAKLLIASGADVNIKNSKEQTALMMATVQEYEELVHLLVITGAEINAEEELKETALMLAIDKGNLPIASLLIDVGANVNAKNNYGATPLMFVAKIKNAKFTVEISEKLRQKGALLETVNSMGVNALMHASFQGNCEMVDFLLDAGADTDVKDKKGKCALFAAAKNGHLKVVESLLKAQADYLAFDNSNFDLVDYAKLSKNREVIRMIDRLPVDIICKTSRGPCFELLKNVVRKLSDPSKQWLHPVERCEVDSMATLMASHDLWCRTNSRIEVPIRSNTWASFFEKNKKTKNFSLGMQDFGVAPLTEISDLVASSATEPKP